MTSRRASTSRLGAGERSYLGKLSDPSRMRASSTGRPRIEPRPVSLPHIPFLDDDSAAIDAPSGSAPARRAPQTTRKPS